MKTHVEFAIDVCNCVMEQKLAIAIKNGPKYVVLNNGEKRLSDRWKTIGEMIFKMYIIMVLNYIFTNLWIV